MSWALFRHLYSLSHRFSEYFLGDFLVHRGLETIQTSPDAEELGAFRRRPDSSDQQEFHVVHVEAAFTVEFVEFIREGLDGFAEFVHVISSEETVVVSYPGFEFVTL